MTIQKLGAVAGLLLLLFAAPPARTQTQFLPLLFSGKTKLSEDQAAQVAGEAGWAPFPGGSRRHAAAAALRPRLCTSLRSMAAALWTARSTYPCTRNCPAGVWQQEDVNRMDGSMYDDTLSKAAAAAAADGSSDVDFAGEAGSPGSKKGHAT